MNPLNAEQLSRLNCLAAVLSHLPGDFTPPSVGEILAMAEWVADGSLNGAMTMEGQSAILYRRSAAREEGNE